MNSFITDLRYSARKLFRTPGFTAVAVGTLAIAIGATTAIFSIVYAVLLKPLPFEAPDRLLKVTSVRRTGGPAAMSALDFIDYRAQSRTVSRMAAISRETMNLTGTTGEPTRLNAMRVSASFFSILGVTPEIGRTFATGEDAPDAPKTVVISDALWRGRFGADRAIAGKPILLDGIAYTVIGVAPPTMTYPGHPDIWPSLQFSHDDLDPGNRGSHSLRGIGRLAPGATVEQANHELQLIGQRLATQYPNSDAGFGGGAFELQSQIVQSSRPALLTLLAAVAFVLLIACANVANLLLVRASTREAEMAVRTALGASRSRIVRQLVTESILLALCASVVGAAIATWVVDAVVAFGPDSLPRLSEIRVDGTMLGFAIALGMVTGIVFGIAPAIHATRPGLSEMLRAGARGSSGRQSARRTRNALVVSEMALAVVLLVGAGLLIRSFARLSGADLGFAPAQLVALDVSLPGVKYKTDHSVGAFGTELLQRLEHAAGVQAAAISYARPLEQSGMTITFEVDGWTPSVPGARRVAEIRPVSSTYFQTLGIPVLRGRSFTDRDRADAPQVVIVSEALARHYFAHEDPMGKRITLGWGRDSSEWGTAANAGGTVVGVVADVKQFGASVDAPELLYLPFPQAPLNEISVIAKSKGAPASLIAAMRGAVHDLDPDVPAYDVQTMEQAASESVSEPQFYTLVLAAFAGVAMLLAALGIYGVVAYGVAQRSRELGIRMALGATQDGVVRLVVRQGLTLTLGGVALGLAAAAALTRLMSTLLVGVGAFDLLTFATAAIVLTGVAALASFVPARRAALVDPSITMRSE